VRAQSNRLQAEQEKLTAAKAVHNAGITRVVDLGLEEAVVAEKEEDGGNEADDYRVPRVDD
jgi:hypothetical protein